MSLNASLALAASYRGDWQHGNEEEGDGGIQGGARVRSNGVRTPLSSRSLHGFMRTCMCRLDIYCVVSHTS